MYFVFLQRNQIANIMESKSIIGFTNVYYTLWQYTKRTSPSISGMQVIEEYRYIKNLSKNLLSAKEKAPRADIDLELRGECSFERITPIYMGMDTVVCFGKYNGLTLAQIAEKDAKYFVWLGNESSISHIVRKTPEFQEIARLEELDRIKKEEERLSTLDVVNSENPFIGNVGEKITVDGKITHTAHIDTDFGMIVIYTISVNGGGFVVYKGSSDIGNLDDVIKITGKVKEHTQYRGVNQTIIQRPKVL